jgi:hypothetical protein
VPCVRRSAGVLAAWEFALSEDTPNGSRVVEAVRDSGMSCDVFVIGADGHGLRRVTRTPGVEGALSWIVR